MRRIIIDTDTASDDAVAIIMAMRSPLFKVEAITVVAGNIPIDLACKNALISVEKSNTYHAPVYKGASKPIDRKLHTAEFAHGLNGMGDIELTEPKQKLEDKHAVDAIIELVAKYPYEIELVAIGPLTNVALAIKQNPNVMKKLKGIFVMGGNGLVEGNITPYAEFNYYVDGLAAKIVSNFNITITQLPWHTCLEGVYVRDNDVTRISELNELGKWVVDINSSLIKYSNENHNINGFVVCDAGIIALMIDPSIGTKYVEASSDIVIDNEEHYGEQVTVDGKTNYNVCTNMSYERFVDLLIELLE
ncbi:Pyrimidine-specific ribonucleoside hydrolase RihB [Candidatus Izimaplasma bacterium HR1]|jgi:purine nucleosidase|uniref:nucleoside hydrolase n=1 Tax=Candidatus Izimoplasma sp. HR1 TaxID=1541959 RepID=UPI0004F805D5|nr:Pyrimidine-specific ribonucleoside hydrolase RihB [Candidatus Izimaplasma bacterium HR1]